MIIVKFLFIIGYSFLFGILCSLGLFNFVPVFILFPFLFWIIFKKPERAIWIIILVVYLLSYVSGFGFIPNGVRWLVELSMLFLLLKTVADRTIYHKPWRLPLFAMFISLLSLLTIVSLSINKISPSSLLFGLRDHFKYILFFYLLINLDFKEEFYRKTITILFIIMILQIPVTIMQKVFWSPNNSLGMNGIPLGYIDIAGGTIGKGDTTAYLVALAAGTIFIIISYIKYNRMQVSPWIVCGGLLIPIMLADSGAGVLLLGFGLLLFLFQRQTLRSLLGILFIGFMVFIISSGWFLMQEGRKGDISTVETVFKWHFATDAFGRPTNKGKAAALVYAYNMVNKDVLTQFCGLGIGGFTANTFVSGGDLAYEIMKYELKPQFARVLIEMGWIGIYILLAWMFFMLRVNRYVFKKTNDNYWKGISLGFYGVLYVYFSFCFYRPVWDFDATSFAFWFLAAAIYSQKVRLENKGQVA